LTFGEKNSRDPPFPTYVIHPLPTLFRKVLLLGQKLEGANINVMGKSQRFMDYCTVPPRGKAFDIGGLLKE